VIGVVQLINRREVGGRGPLPFDRQQSDLIVPLNHIVGSAIERAAMLERIAGQNLRLKERNRKLRQQRERIAALKDETEEAFQLSIELLARAAELHDEDTSRHVKRVNEYSYYLARRLGMEADFCDQIRYSAQLHDVGKMSIDVAILRKSGPLDEREMAEMKRHPVYGHRILSASERLRMAAEIALNHHERWDGSGYPAGKRGEEIPISARIVTLVDVYDALRSRRAYKPGFTHEQARDVLRNGDERLDPPRHFDPEVWRVFVEHDSGFARIWESLADSGSG
jgi:HD-GYP domain-containing protein (c-di-GMP phosphodiesterase class II)